MRMRPIALAICVCALSVLSVRAATLIVTTTADSGPGSLRDTIAAATAGDTIQFAAALNGQTITLTSAELLIDKNLTISGPGATQLTVMRSTAGGTPAFRIFEITPGLTVTIQGLTISNGAAPFGGGIPECDGGELAGGGRGGAIYNKGSTLTIANSMISGSHTGFGGGIFNDAVQASAQLTISNSSVSGNSADITSSGNGGGGGIFNYGEGAFYAAVVLNDSTISGNHAQAYGGGIFNDGFNAFLFINNSTIRSNSAPVEGGGIANFFQGLVTVSNSTISGNSAGVGGGISGGGTITNSTINGNAANQGGSIYAFTAVEIANTILKAGVGANISNNGGTVTSHGYNLSSDDGGGFLNAIGDQINTDPMLGPLQDNGGPTFTHELLIGSPALNAGDPAFTPPPDFDQRGSGFPRVINGRIDIGSFELQTIAPTPTPTATATMAPSPTPSCPPVITQSSSQAITTGNSISCNNGTGHTDNSYWRAFSVGTSFGGSYIITSVSFGIESANNTQPVTARLYRNTGGAFPGGTRTLIGTTTISVTAAQTGTVVTTPLSAGLPAGLNELVMELFTPDGQAAGNLFFVGSNASPESGPSYLSATACGITTPTTTAALGFPNMHIVFNVQGFCEGTPPPPSPTATATTTVTPTATATVTATATAAGTPTPTPTPSVSPSATPTPSAAQPLNLSTRMRVLTEANVGIGGFIITGSVPKHVILRAIGPSLAGSGVPDPLADPVMELHGPPGFVTIISDDARDRACTFGPVSHPSSSSDALPLPSSLPRLKGEPMCLIGPSNDLEPCICATLDPGAYTAIVRGKNNTSGVALVEVYDLDQAAASKMANISTRAFVNTGANIMIAGFILGNGAGADTIILRGIGPSLTQFGVPNALTNPTLELRNSSGTLIRSNDNWMDDPAQKALIMAAGLGPTNMLESAIYETLAPGQYTALLSGVNNGTGVGLVEVYDRGAP